MTSTVNVDAYSNALVVLGTASIVVPLLRRAGVSAILAYLGAGALLGPFGLGAFARSFPPLYWVTITDAANIAGISELGVVFLLFLIGLELPFHRLATMRSLVFGLGGLQILLTAAAIAGVVAAAGRAAPVAVIVGLCLSLSSTAIVIELLASQERLMTDAGRAAFSVLLAQDLAIVPLLLFVSTFATGGKTSAFANLASALVQAAVAIAVIIAAGRFMLRPLFRLAATLQPRELFVAAVLFVIVGAGVIAEQAHLPMALGAFVAGLLLAETEFTKAIQTAIEPFKGLLLGIFFFTIGMSIDVRELAREPVWLGVVILGLIALKAAIVILLARLFRLSWSSGVEAGAVLAPGGEFAFVGMSAATAVGLIEVSFANFILALTAVTMAFIPLLSSVTQRLLAWSKSAKRVDPELLVRPATAARHAVVVGYGRVGKVVCSLLARHSIPHIAVDRNPIEVARDRREGHNVYYGNAADPEFLRACGVMEAAGVVVTIQEPKTIDDIVAHLRALRPDLLIVSRARDAEHARRLYQAGATDAVPETVEASLQLSEAFLVGLGVPMGAAIATVHEKRDEFRRLLRQAAQGGGRPAP